MPEAVERIAVATVDGVNLSQHFGQSRGFLVFMVEGSKIIGSEMRFSSATPHDGGICNHGEQPPSPKPAPQGILELLHDCGVVLCGGMGAGAAQTLLGNGIKPVIIQGAQTAMDAATSFLRGDTAATPPGFCNCHH